MNASTFITFFTKMLRQKNILFLSEVFTTFQLIPNKKRNTIFFSSYSPLDASHYITLTKSAHRAYRGKHIVLTKGKMSLFPLLSLPNFYMKLLKSKMFLRNCNKSFSFSSKSRNLLILQTYCKQNIIFFS